MKIKKILLLTLAFCCLLSSCGETMTTTENETTVLSSEETTTKKKTTEETTTEKQVEKQDPVTLKLYKLASDKTSYPTFTADVISTIYGPTEKNKAPTLTYGKVTVLQYSGEDYNGRILATVEDLQAGCYYYKVYLSQDGGYTWKKIGQVYDPDTTVTSNYQPMIYELPCAVGDYPAGTLVFGGCSYGARKDIVLYVSTDHGYKWSKKSVVCSVEEPETKPDEISWGVWEPCLYAEDGVLYCLYSDDAHPRCSQALVLKYSSNLTDWSDQVDIATMTDGTMRPGMISIAKMNNGEYFVSYELIQVQSGTQVHLGNHYKKSTNILNWDAGTTGTRIECNGYYLNGSPWCTWTPAGGECGTLICTGSYASQTSIKGQSDLMVSFDYGVTWKRLQNPLPFYEDGGREGYSAGLFTANDGTVYFVNTINSDIEGKSKLCFAHIVIQ